MNLKRYNGEFYIMEYEETEEKNLKLFYRKKEILNLVSKELSRETLDKLNELL